MFKESILKTIEDLWPETWQTAKYLYDNPELGGKEYKAVNKLTQILKEYGFTITSPYLGLDTSFKATLGTGKPVIYLLAEYDALPQIGHGCGHHLIAGASLGAAIALASLKDLWSGTLVVLGTPAEETEGGKVLLTKRGAFSDCDAALIFHPGQSAVINISSQALEALEVVFYGNYGHSAGKHDYGNPLVSLVNLFQDTWLYNKSYYPEQEIQGVITEGGITPNLIPEKAIGKFYLRAITLMKLKKLILNFRKMAERSAMNYRTEVTIRSFESRYLPMNTNLTLAKIFNQQIKSLGVDMDLKKWQIVGSIDMGNVSWEVPAIHPYLPLGEGNISAHTLNFVKLAGGQEGQKTMLLATKALALTCLELFTNPYLVDKLWEDFRKIVEVKQ